MNDYEEIIKRLIEIKVLINKPNRIVDYKMTSNIDYLKGKVMLFYLKGPINYSMYDDVYSYGILSHHYKRLVCNDTVIVAKVKDITFFGLLIQLHRSIELVSLEFSNIDRITSIYKWIFVNLHLKSIDRLKEKKDLERLVINLDTDFVEWTDNKEPNLIPTSLNHDNLFSPDIRSPLHQDNLEQNNSK